MGVDAESSTEENYHQLKSVSNSQNKYQRNTCMLINQDYDWKDPKYTQGIRLYS